METQVHAKMSQPSSMFSFIRIFLFLKDLDARITRFSDSLIILARVLEANSTSQYSCFLGLNPILTPQRFLKCKIDQVFKRHEQFSVRICWYLENFL